MQRIATVVRRPYVVMLVFGALAVLLVFNGSGSSQAASTYVFQGMGPTTGISSAERHSAAKVVNMSTDRGWRAEIAPAFGSQTLDQSVTSGGAIAWNEVTADLEAGKTVTLQGFSLGALTAGDLANRLAENHVDTTHLKVDVYSDGREAGSGALVALQPFAPALKLFGITTGPRPSLPGQWTIHCVQHDGVCDTPNPLKDPVGAVDSLVGYFMYHGKQDPVYNYNNLGNLQSTSVKSGDDTYVTYHTPHPITRAVEVFGHTTALSPTLNTVLDALTLSSGDPGQAKTYKTDDPVVSMANALGLRIPAPATVPAPNATGGNDWIQNGIQTLENFANGQMPAATPAVAQTPVYTAPAAQEPSYTAPVAAQSAYQAPAQPVYQAPQPVQQAVTTTWSNNVAPVMNQIRQAAPQAAPIVQQATQAAHDIAGQFGIRLP